MTYYHVNDSALSIENLTKKFLTITFSSTEKNTYRKNGFYPYITLNEIFKNAYTQISGDELQIRAMSAEDIYIVTGLTDMVNGKSVHLADLKYNKLFIIESQYWIATPYDTDVIWRITLSGASQFYRNGESRYSTGCFSKLHSKSQ